MSRGSPHHAIRIPPDELWIWDAAKEVAEARGTSLSAEIRRFLKRYVRRGRS